MVRVAGDGSGGDVTAALPQASRPFVVTDPNGPITFGDLYDMLTRLAAAPVSCRGRLNRAPSFSTLKTRLQESDKRS